MKLSFATALLVSSLGSCSLPVAFGDSKSQNEESRTYRLSTRQGRTVIVDQSAKPLPWTSYSLTSHSILKLWEKMQEPFIRAGVDLFQVQIWPGNAYWQNPFWSKTGKPVVNPGGASSLRRQIESLIKRVPKARFIIRIRIHPDQYWKAMHLKEFQPLPKDDAKAGAGQAVNYSVMPSLASELCLERTKQMVHDHIKWCESQKWSKRIVAYTLLPLGEGATEVALRGGYFDRSEVMNRAFRDWVKGRYKTDEELRKAWRDKSISRDRVSVPTNAQWQAKRRAQKILHWPDPVKVRRERDYFELQKHLFHRWWRQVISAARAATAGRDCLIGMDNFKQPQHGWLHDPAFTGSWQEGTLDRYSAWQLASGCMGIGPLLDMPELNVVWTPGIYYNRAMGYAWEAEGVSDSLSLRGKLHYGEGDFRNWNTQDLYGRRQVKKQVAGAGVAMNPAEAQATFRRALGWAFSRNQVFWFCSVYGGNWWFHEPELQPMLDESHEAIKQSLDMPWSPQRDAICLVIDDESAFYEDFSAGFQFLAVQRQLEEGLARTGVPYRIHLFSDLDHPKMPDYKCWLFPNLFKIDEARLALLRRKVLRDGNVAIFGPGTGITDGETRSAKPASKLFGLEMELILKRSFRRLLVSGQLARQIPPTMVSDSYSYGPILIPSMQRLPKGKDYRPLGSAFYYYHLDRPGCFLRELGKGASGNGNPGKRGPGDAAMVFMPAVPIPATLLREFARYAGAHVYSEQNAVVSASPGFVSLHVPTAGEWELALPHSVDVFDMTTRKALARKVERLSLKTANPYTWLLEIRRPR